jgi:hypothetical protein
MINETIKASNQDMILIYCVVKLIEICIDLEKADKVFTFFSHLFFYITFTTFDNLFMHNDDDVVGEIKRSHATVEGMASFNPGC